MVRTDLSMKYRMSRLTGFLLLCAALWASAATAATPAGDLGSFSGWPKKKPVPVNENPAFLDVSVHDPSVIRANGAWYVFGSHLAEARTTDLLQWELLADGVTRNNPLFVDAIAELQDIYAWSGAYDLWANDVIQLEDGRYYMYPNLSQGDAPRASLGLAIADDVEGPYEYQGIFLQSGMWDEISEDGVNIYDPQIHPNTVDPDAFFDRDGKLWMIYGSYSGGIFILEMDPDTGLPFPSQGYGTHLMGGNHSRIEGPNVLYSPQSGYYYLFVSFGGLAADGGYNIRVSRSRAPDGPWYDGLGNDMAEVKSDPNLPLFDDASIEPFAQKLMGNFEFRQQPREPGAGGSIGYVSPGHNTSFRDEATGQYFLIFHTRFPGQGEFHQVRVHEMFINEDGWPVVAPHRYVPHPAGPYATSRQDADFYGAYRGLCLYKLRCWELQGSGLEDTVGEYKLVNHGKDISDEIKVSRLVTLHAGGGISGDVTGHWFRSFGNRITIELDGEGLFKGVLSWGWNEISEQFVMTFTALSDEGVSIWGSKLAE
jgi:arabinan endo-1,5-alpha-L-arabinosidase